MLKPQGTSGKRLQSWIRHKTDMIHRQVVAKKNWVDMANSNMQLHGDLVSVTEEYTEDIARIQCGSGTGCLEKVESRG